MSLELKIADIIEAAIDSYAINYRLAENDLERERTDNSVMSFLYNSGLDIPIIADYMDMYQRRRETI